MLSKVLPPRLPSVRRWFQLCRRFGGNSVLRSLEYEKLEELQLRGLGLDVGGGKKARYLPHLSGDFELESVNIDAEIEPTFMVKPEERFPIEDQKYDFIISMNTLEHIYDPRFVLDEMIRVLKPGGIVYIMVPFMFRIHAHPDDFTRATPSWWFETFRRVGFREAMVYPLVWGRSTTGGSLSGYQGILPRKVMTHVAALIDVLYARIRGQNSTHYQGKIGERIWAVSQGWFMEVKK